MENQPLIDAALDEAVNQALTVALTAVSPPIRQVLRFFRFKHLPEGPLRAMSRDFADVATRVAIASSNPETTAGLRKLLEAKDCAVRSLIPEE